MRKAIFETEHDEDLMSLRDVLGVLEGGCGCCRIPGNHLERLAIRMSSVLIVPVESR